MDDRRVRIVEEGQGTAELIHDRKFLPVAPSAIEPFLKGHAVDLLLDDVEAILIVDYLEDLSEVRVLVIF